MIKLNFYFIEVYNQAQILYAYYAHWSQTLALISRGEQKSEYTVTTINNDLKMKYIQPFLIIIIVSDPCLIGTAWLSDWSVGIMKETIWVVFPSCWLKKKVEGASTFQKLEKQECLS